MELVNLKTKKAGFSLPEMIIVMACLSVIISLSVGDMSRMFVKQTSEQERLNLQNIRKAMEVYSQREGILPLDETECSIGDKTDGRWNVEFAKYAEMTADRMCMDEFGNPRKYQVQEITQNFRNGDFKYKVQLGSVLSYGANMQEDTTPWRGVSGGNGYTLFQAKGDDFIVKYNNNDHKLAQYEETLNRIDLLEQYLERYYRTKLAYAMSLDIDEADNYIMYPKDGRSNDLAGYFNSDSSELSSNDEFTSDIEVDTLKKSMNAVELTQVLGVPEYYGRSALTGDSLWYISNPGPDRTRPCDGARKKPPYYPPAIILTSNGRAPTGCN